MEGRRRGHCSVAIGSWLFIIGGLLEEQNTNSVKAFDTNLLEGDAPAQWIDKAETIYDRFLLSCQVFTFEGEEGIFAGGGKGRGVDVWDSVEFYSVAGDAWRAIGALNRARNSFAMSLVGKQVGGKDFTSCFFSHLFEPCLSDRWLCQEGRQAASA